MTSFADWASLFGYMCLFFSLLAGFYFLLPGPRKPEDEGGWRLRREKPTAPTLLALVSQAEVHAAHQPDHARRVASLALALAEATGFAPAERGRLEKAALMLDIGVLDLPADLFARPGLLSQAELVRVWAHAAQGAVRAEALTRDPALAAWIRWSHERWDGLGYPDGLAGTQIPLACRILRLADTAETMLRPRPYRPAFRPEDVMTEINRLAGIAYDPELARVFVDYVLPRHTDALNVDT